MTYVGWDNREYEDPEREAMREDMDAARWLRGGSDQGDPRHGEHCIDSQTGKPACGSPESHGKSFATPRTGDEAEWAEARALVARVRLGIDA